MVPALIFVTIMLVILTSAVGVKLLETVRKQRAALAAGRYVDEYHYGMLSIVLGAAVGLGVAVIVSPWIVFLKG